LRTKFVSPYFALSDVVSGDAPAGEKLRAFLTAEMELLLEYSRTENLLPNIMMTPDFIRNSILGDAVCAVLGHKFKLVLQIVDEGMARGEFREDDPRIAAIRVIGASNAFAAAVTKSLLHAQAPTVPYDEETRDAFFRGIFHGLQDSGKIDG
jgi:hypothetical protein